MSLEEGSGSRCRVLASLSLPSKVPDADGSHDASSKGGYCEGAM